MTRPEDRLAPCPHCGKEPWGMFGPVPQELPEGYTLYFPVGSCWVECHGDYEGALCGDWVFEGTRDETAAAWNRRAALPATPSEPAAQVALPELPVCPGTGTTHWPARDAKAMRNYATAAVLADRAALAAASRGTGDAEALRLFALDIMECWPHGDVDGADLQNIAVKHGLLAPKVMHAPCGDNVTTYCSCVSDAGCDDKDFAKGVECFRRTSLLTGARSAAQGDGRG